jgi:hypothetical protein
VANTSIAVPITIRDLAEGLTAEISPNIVEVLVTGPEPVINTLRPDDVVVFVSLDGYEPGTAFVELEWDVLLIEVQVVSINPDTIEVIITDPEDGLLPTSTPSP